MELFNSLEPLQKYFWIIACCASLIFIIQTIMTFVGLGTDADVDAGPMDGAVDSVEDGELSGVFSFRNLINFLLGYGWAGALLFGSIDKRWLLDELPDFLDYTMKNRTYRYYTGEALFPFGYGLSYTTFEIGKPVYQNNKVQVSVKGSVHEVDAVTDRGEEIPTGGQVKIVDALGNDLLLVE